VARIVNLYLLITGIGAFVALAMPGVVVIAMFLVVPGLILAIMPTAFLWGLAFAVPWWLLRSMLGDWPAALAAFAMAAAALWLAPMPSVLISRLRLAQAIDREILPPEKIRLAGHIRLDVPSMAVEKVPPGTMYDADEVARRPYVCEALCAALLATPAVESVTVNAHADARDEDSPLTPHARTFRVVPKSQCVGPTVRPQNADALDIRRPRPPGGLMQGLVQTFQAEWDVRLSARDCIIAEAPRTEHDLVIRKFRYRRFGTSSFGADWSLLPRPVDVERLDVIDGAGHRLLSKTLAKTRVLVQPLQIGAEGGIENFRFGWARKDVSNGKRYEEFKPNQLLADHTTLRTEVDRAAIIKASRDRLAEALADPSLPASDPAFKLADPWLRSLAGQMASDEDLALLGKAIRDPRVSEYGGIWEAVKAAADRAGELREPLIDRIAALDLSAREQPKALGNVLGALPPGTFVTLTGKERAILADPVRRRFAPGLIARQADRGAAAVPLLLDILQFHLNEIASAARDRRDSGEGNMVAVDRVRMALCVLGPDGASALPAIDALGSQGLVDRRFAEDRNWQLMLARIGKPVETIAKPANLSGTEAQFHENLRRRLDRFRPERDCRAQWG
jgi:hypothetical protein